MKRDVVKKDIPMRDTNILIALNICLSSAIFAKESVLLNSSVA